MSHVPVKWGLVRIIVSFYTEEKKSRMELMDRENFRTDFKTLGVDGGSDSIDAMLDTECADHYEDWLDDTFVQAEYHDCRGPMPDGVYEVIAELWGYVWSDTTWEGEHDGGFEVTLKEVQIHKLDEAQTADLIERLNNDYPDMYTDEEGEEESNGG